MIFLSVKYGFVCLHVTACSSMYVCICIKWLCDKHTYINIFIHTHSAYYARTFPTHQHGHDKQTKIDGPWAFFRTFPWYPLVIFPDLAEKTFSAIHGLRIQYTVKSHQPQKNANKKHLKCWNFWIFQTKRGPPLWHLEDVEFCWAKLEMRAGPEVHKLVNIGCAGSYCIQMHLLTPN